MTSLNRNWRVLMVTLLAAVGLQCTRSADEGLFFTDPNAAHYNTRFSGRSLTSKDPNDSSKGHPLFNTYSSWIHQRSHGVYGFSLDDDEGLKACQSPTLNAVGCPVCIPDSTGRNCQLPTKSLPDPVTKATLQPATITDPTTQTSVYVPKESYLKPSWLTLNKFDATRGSIDTDFSAFPDNQFYAINQAPTREHPFHVAFNIANQSGLANSTCRMPVPMWVTIDIGSPNLILAYQKIEPGEGYQFLINMYDPTLRQLLARTPSLPNPYISGPLVGNNGTERCAVECNATTERNTLAVDCQDIAKNTCSTTTNTTEFPTGYDFCTCPETGSHCNPNYKIKDGNCYDLRFADNAQPVGFPHPPPCSPCYVQTPPMCADLSDPNTPACCFNQSYSATNYAGSQACSEGNYFDWQLGGGRIIISYVDPKTQAGLLEEDKRTQPKNCTLSPDSCDPNIPATWNAQIPETGAKMAAVEQDRYAALLEFTVDYFMNVPGPDGYKGATVFYDISSVDSLNLPVYLKAVGKNEKPQEKCVSNGGQCCLSFIGSPQAYVEPSGGPLKAGCPTDIFNNKSANGTIPWWGNCISPYDYCSNRDVGASGNKSVDSAICNVWNNFEAESPPFAEYKTIRTFGTPLTDDATLTMLSNSCGNTWLSKGFITNLQGARTFAANSLLWPNEKTCKAEFIVTNSSNTDSKLCCEPRMKDYVNNVIWGCESASSVVATKNQIKINNEKCRAMNWGVFPNYSTKNSQIVGATAYERPSELLTPLQFECNLESCDVTFANKPYNGSAASMNCTGPSDPGKCCGATSSEFCYGIAAP